MAPTEPERRRPARRTEEVAGQLRKRIVSGDLAHGTLLPPHEELLRELDVSMPTLREALRILEVEGLISVRRGRGGGAVVHRPTASQAGYLLALVMESQSVTLGDVLRSLVDLEPVCAGGCAGRADRRTTVLPRLEASVRDSLAVIDDARAYAVAARAFHHELVVGCGTQTTVLLVEALEAIWNAHVDRFVQADTHLGPFRSRAVRLDTVREHEHICELIRAGDVDATVRSMRAHYARSAPDGRERQFRIDLGMGVDAGLLRD